MVYFVDRDIPRNSDYAEIKRVDDYKAEYGSKGVYAKYEHSKIMDHLYKKVIDYKAKQPIIISSNGSSAQLTQTQTVSNVYTSVVSVEKLMLEDKFSNKELLIFAYIIYTENRRFGIGGVDNTALNIMKWESEKNLQPFLSTNYSTSIQNLFDRGLMKKIGTNLYSMPIPIYDEIRSLSVFMKERIVNAMFVVTIH